MHCEWCRESIEFLDAKILSGSSAWHTRCWNEAAAEREAFRAQCEEIAAFSSLPDELIESETGRQPVGGNFNDANTIEPKTARSCRLSG